jgi:hypothetical protein
MRGFFASLRMTSKYWNKGKSRAKAKYGGLSTAAARAPPSVEMTEYG